MKKEIILEGRGVRHKLIHVEGNKYQLDTDFNYRVGFQNNEDDITFIDPAGGPFMHVGYEIDGRKIKKLYNGGIIEFEDDISGDKTT